MTRSRAPSGRAAAVALAAALGGGLPSVPAGASAGAAELQCRLAAPAQGRASAPLVLRFAITNSGPGALRVLDWNTPFEPGWFAPFVELQRDGQAVAYRGASMKRGEPAAGDYLTIGARRTRHSRVDLAEAFDLTQPGHYRVEPHITLHDVVTDGAHVPRPRAVHHAQTLPCNAVEFDLK